MTCLTLNAIQTIHLTTPVGLQGAAAPLPRLPKWQVWGRQTPVRQLFCLGEASQVRLIRLGQFGQVSCFSIFRFIIGISDLGIKHFRDKLLCDKRIRDKLFWDNVFGIEILPLVYFQFECFHVRPTDFCTLFKVRNVMGTFIMGGLILKQQQAIEHTKKVDSRGNRTRGFLIMSRLS